MRKTKIICTIGPASQSPEMIKEMIEAGMAPKKATVLILGLTFKENCPDTRNSKIIDIVKELNEYGIDPVIVDTTADGAEAQRLYGVELSGKEALKDMDAVIIAVAHEDFAHLTKDEISGYFNPANKTKVLLDIKGILNRKEYEKDFSYWRL